MSVLVLATIAPRPSCAADSRRTTAGSHDPAVMLPYSRHRWKEGSSGAICEPMLSPEPRYLHLESVATCPPGLKTLVPTERLQCFALSAKSLDHGPGHWLGPHMKDVLDYAGPGVLA